MVAGAAAGELVNRGEGPFTLAEMQAWADERTVRAAVLRHLLIAGQWPVDAKGVRLRGVRISGLLDLEVAAIRCPLWLNYCYHDADEPVCLDYATASRLTLTGCQLAGLTGEMLTARALNLSDSTLSASLRLPGADITGELSCSGAQLTGTDGDGNALVADGMKVGGAVFLDGGFTAAGAVRLLGADITGQLMCRGAQLTGTDGDGNALGADGIKVSGGVFLDGGFTAAGAVRLHSADITGQLNCTGAQLTGTDSDGNALVAYGIKVSGAVFLDGGFTAAGAVRLLQADIIGQLDCSGAQLTGTDGYALVADGMKVSGAVFLDGGFTAAGAVRLRDADITGQLGCRGAQLTGTDSDGNALVADGMKVDGDVFLIEGFTAAGAVRLHSADITGQLNCTGAQLTGTDGDGNALVAYGIKVGGGVFLGVGFTAAGAVRLTGADITGQLGCGGAQLTGADGDGNALVADGMKVSSGVFLDDGFTAAGAVRLTGADITGQLGCRGAQLTGTDSDGNALVAEGMKVSGGVFLDDGFTAAGAVRLPGADITGQLGCGGAQLTGIGNDGNALVADGLKVSGDVFLRGGFTAAGAVRLPGADITGQLGCRGAQLTGTDSDGNALVADGLKVGGGVFLDDGFTAAGAVRLHSADITGQLGCSGARLTGGDGDGNALVADGLKVSGVVFLRGGFTAAGAVRLPGADITGQLGCTGARLTGTDSDGNTLVADGMKVSGAVFLDGEFSAAGTISLASAHVGLSVHLAPTALASENKAALNAPRARIAGTLEWAPAGPVSGQVNLDGATVGQLDDDWSNERPNGYWPTGGRLRLDGFTYGRFGGKQQATAEQRLAWLRSQHQPPAGDNTADFATQPYEQLAAVYRQAGQDAEARKVAIARRADLRKYGDLNPYRRFGNWFLDWSIKYGYQTWRAAAGLAALFVVFLALSVLAQHQHAIVPIGEIEGLHSVPSVTQCTSDYPCFYPVGYTVDTVIPIINVHQADYWGADGHAPWGWFWVGLTWLATGLGWLLATLLVAGYTGLVRRD